MTQYRVTISHDACTVHDVESCSPEEAAERAMESCGSVTLCHHCSDELQMGDPIRVACVENLEDGTHIDAVDPEVAALQARVAALQVRVAELGAVAQPPTDAQIVSRAMEAGDLDDLCVLVDYDPDTGPVRQRWVPRGPVRRLAHAIVRANKPGATK